MKLRVAWPLLAGLILLMGACATDDGGPRATGPSAAIAETRLDECVIDQGTQKPAEATGDTFETKEEGVLLVGSDTTFPPFESVEDGQVVGFDVDLMEEIGERIGDLEVEFQTAAFDTIFTALAAGKFDVVISAVTIKEDRKKTVDFTDPYFVADQSLSVRRADRDEIGGIDDLEGKVVGVQSGTTGEDCAKNALKAKDLISDVRAYDTAPEAFSDLQAGRIDAVLVDLPTAQQIVEKREGAVVVQVIRTSEEYGIAVDKKNPNLREAINEALEEIRSDGTYERIFKEWLGTEPPG